MRASAQFADRSPGVGSNRVIGPVLERELNQLRLKWVHVRSLIRYRFLFHWRSVRWKKLLDFVNYNPIIALLTWH